MIQDKDSLVYKGAQRKASLENGSGTCSSNIEFELR